MTNHHYILHLALLFSGLILVNSDAKGGRVKVTVVGTGSMCSFSKPVSQTTRASYTYSRATVYPRPQMYHYQAYKTPSIRIPKKSSGNKTRTFTNINGHKVEARLLSISSRNRTARIRTAKGLCYNVSISKFCPSDISFLKSWWHKRNPRKG